MYIHICTVVCSTQVAQICPRIEKLHWLLFYSVAPYNVTIMGDNTYSQGEQLHLSCLSEGGPELEYTWTFSGDVIANTSMLTILNVTTFNGGDYTCSVSNDAGPNMETITVYSKFFVLYTICTVQRNIKISVNYTGKSYWRRKVW